MDTKDVKTVLMYGPQISDPAKMEERAVPADDVPAYEALGWQAGAMPKDAKAEDVVVPDPAPAVMAPVVDPEAPSEEEAAATEKADKAADKAAAKAEPKAKKGKK
jgi:hypothetical protein